MFKGVAKAREPEKLVLDEYDLKVSESELQKSKD